MLIYLFVLSRTRIIREGGKSNFAFVLFEVSIFFLFLRFEIPGT